ncbi:hypothetical protein D3C80_1988340 [compost metagenome]
MTSPAKLSLTVAPAASPGKPETASVLLSPVPLLSGEGVGAASLDGDGDDETSGVAEGDGSGVAVASGSGVTVAEG